MSTTFLDSEHSRVHLEQVEKLHDMKGSATLIIDGWEDDLRRSLYGTAAGRVGEPSVVMGLQDLTGHRGSAVKIQEAAEDAMKEMLIEKAEAFLALVTDNPNVMKVFRNQFEKDYWWIIVSVRSQCISDVNLHVLSDISLLGTPNQHNCWRDLQLCHC